MGISVENMVNDGKSLGLQLPSEKVVLVGSRVVDTFLESYGAL